MNELDQRINELQAEIDRLKAQRKRVSNDNQRLADAQTQALAIGVKPEKVKEFLSLVDVSRAGDSVEIGNILRTALNFYPEYMGSGGSGAGAGAKKLTIDDLRTMTTEQIMANLEEANRVVAEASKNKAGGNK